MYISDHFKVVCYPSVSRSKQRAVAMRAACRKTAKVMHSKKCEIEFYFDVNCVRENC